MKLFQTEYRSGRVEVDLDDGVGAPGVLDGEPGVPRRPLALNERRDLQVVVEMMLVMVEMSKMIKMMSITMQVAKMTK